jgi:hypothetical protein
LSPRRLALRVSKGHHWDILNTWLYIGAVPPFRNFISYFKIYGATGMHTFGGYSLFRASHVFSLNQLPRPDFALHFLNGCEQDRSSIKTLASPSHDSKSSWGCKKYEIVFPSAMLARAYRKSYVQSNCLISWLLAYTFEVIPLIAPHTTRSLPWFWRIPPSTVI